MRRRGQWPYIPAEKEERSLKERSKEGEGKKERKKGRGKEGMRREEEEAIHPSCPPSIRGDS